MPVTSEAVGYCARRFRWVKVVVVGESDGAIHDAFAYKSVTMMHGPPRMGPEHTPEAESSRENSRTPERLTIAPAVSLDS
jgi:hypothetical protein